MNIRIRSYITQSRIEPDRWLVATHVYDLDAPYRVSYVMGAGAVADSHQAALDLAAQQRADLDAELMEGVHESRASRRTEAHA